MDALMASLRLVHLVFGVFLVGNVFFTTLILEPRLRALGPAIQNPVMGALGPVISVAQMISLLLVVASGAAMALVLRAGNLASFVTTGWGWAILAGTVVTIAAGGVGFGMMTPLGMRLGNLARGMQGRPPTPDEARQMGQLSQRLETLTRVNFVLSLIVVGTMAVARYV